MLVLCLAATPTKGTGVKIGAIFDKKPGTTSNGRPWQDPFNGWAANHALAAAAAALSINNDTNILPGVELQLVDIDIDAVRASAWLQGANSTSEQCFLRQVHANEARLLRTSLLEQLDNITALVGVGYSSDVATLSPWLVHRNLMLVTHAAESSIFSDKGHHPLVARMSRANMKAQAHAMIDVVQGVVKHTSVKLLSCEDAYCSDCALQVQNRAQALDVKIAQHIMLHYKTFKNDVSGRIEITNFLSDCSQATVVIMCTHAEQANEVFRAAKYLNLDTRNIWLVPVDTAVATQYHEDIPYGTLGLNLPPKDSATMAQSNTFSLHWHSQDPTSSALQSFITGDDPYVAFAIDSVYVVARALHDMHQAGFPLDNGTALREAIGANNFQGVSGGIAFDSRLDPIESGRFDVVNFVTGGSWRRIGYVRNGAINVTCSNIQWPVRATPRQICIDCTISIGGLFAVQGQVQNYHDVQSYYAAQVAIMRIQAGEHLKMPNGTSIGAILPNVDIRLSLGDTSHIRSMSSPDETQLSRFKASELNETIRTLMLSDTPVGFVGLGYSRYE